MRFRKLSLVIILIWMALSVSPGGAGLTRAADDISTFLPLIQRSPAPGGILAPSLKWQRGGCYTSWCETGWYSSPAVADLDGDGSKEVIGSAYSIVVLDGTSGNLEWRVSSGHDRREPEASNTGRTWPGIVVADVDGDDSLEIVTAHGGGYVSVYEWDGYFSPGWPQQPTGGLEVRGLAVSDLEGDGTLEIIAMGAVYGEVNTWVYEHHGGLRPGWPQLSDDSGYAYGIFNDNAAIGDLDGDGFSELVVPSDVHYICAYEPDGSQIPANPVYGDKGWGKVGVWESLEIELRGWGTCDPSDARSERFRANFAHGPGTMADVDGNGDMEVVVTGNVYDCGYGNYPSQYIGIYIFNSDRSRYQKDGFDWRAGPVDTGSPLSENYNQIENAQPNPVVADLDGDGIEEMLFTSYDGHLHAFWLDKSEHGSWPYSVNDPGEGIFRFASEPTVVDLNADGRAEVIFASWVEKGSGAIGKLHILDYLGNPVHEIDLPAAFSGDWNGALAAPTLADIDGDPDLEVVLNTAHSGLVAYDLPGTSGASILWGTGRGNYWRDGYLP
jgi:hypothetical protein